MATVPDIIVEVRLRKGSKYIIYAAAILTFMMPAALRFLVIRVLAKLLVTTKVKSDGRPA